jgi:hypothetical protein
MLHGLTPPPKFTRFCSQDLDGVLRPIDRISPSLDPLDSKRYDGEI